MISSAKSALAFPATPFPYLLRSNIAPSPLEFSAVSKAILDAEALRSSLNSQLIERKASANLVWKAITKQKIQRLEKFIASHNGILSVIRRIPSEIIQEIFQWLSAILRREARSKPKWALPFAYGQICSSWRGGALSVHSLWSLFPEIRKPISHVGKELQVKYMTELLHRSRQSPIQFCIDITSWYNPIRDLLVQSSGRWQVVSTRGSATEIHNFFHEIRGRIPNLESLTISVVFGASLDTLDMFQTAPKLREVRLSGYEISAIKLPNHQLVDFCSLAMRNRNLLSHLTNAHHLENFTCGEWGPITTNINAICLPSLKRLHVQLTRSSQTILDFLTVPILECLRISVILVSLDTILLRSLAEMASRSESGNLPHLQELHIWSTLDKMPEGLDEVLRLTPALRILDTLIPSPRDILALASVNTGSGVPLVTSLKYCYFGVSKALVPEIFSALKELTYSRCELRPRCISPLRGIRLATECGQWWNKTSRGDTKNNVRIIRQSQLELWEASETSILLTVLKERLFGFVPGLSKRNPVLPNKPSKGNWFQNMQDLLDEIENVEIDDAIDILVSLFTSPSVNIKHRCRYPKYIWDWNA